MRSTTDEEYHKKLTGSAPGEVLVSKTDPLKSFLEWNDSGKAEAGKGKSFDIITIDSDGEKCFQEIDEIKGRVQSPTGMDLDLNLYYQSRWRYSCAFKPLCDGKHEMTVSVNDQPLPGTPKRLLVAPCVYPLAIRFQPRRKASHFKKPCAVAIDNRTGNWVVLDRKKKRMRIFESVEHDPK